MSIAVRRQITVPAAGTFAYVGVAGRVVYVEESPDNTPEGVPTFHLTRGGSGVPLYSRSALAYLPAWPHFYVRGTAESAGATLYLLIYDDPCGEGVHGPGASFVPNPCSEGGDVPLPAGDPSAYLAFKSSRIEVVDYNGNSVRTIVNKTGAQIGSGHVDYVARRIWYGMENESGNCSLWRVDFDGDNDTEVKDTEHETFGGSVHGVSWDSALGRFILTQHNAWFAISPDGGQMTTFATTGNGRVHSAARGDGVHAYVGDGQSLRYRTYAGTNTALISGTRYLVIVDPLGTGVFSGFGSLIRYEYDLAAGETIDDDLPNGPIIGAIYGRHLYYSARVAFGNAPLRRLHLDRMKIENLSLVVGTTVEGLWPWWDD